MNIKSFFSAAALLAVPVLPLMAKTRPNILFILADDATYYHWSANGCPWVNTPNFDRVAHEGVVFDNCYTPNAKSAPSRAVLLTGRYSWELGEAGNHISNFPLDIKVVTDVLKENGYQCAYTGKGWAPGFPGLVNGKIRELTGKAYQEKTLKPPTTGIFNADYAGNFELFLKDKEKGKPFFFWFGSREPHRSYQYHSGVEKGKKNIDMIKHVPAYWPDNETVRNDMLDYGYEIEYLDKQIGKAIKMLKENGELENTIIFITSDNGMPFPRSKANNYNYSNHMPMAIMWPKGIKNPGRRIKDYVSFVDVTPTFLDIAGVKDYEKVLPLSGHSWRSILEDQMTAKEKDMRKIILFGRERDDYGRPHNAGYPIRAIMRDGIIYINNMCSERWPAGHPLTGYLDVDGSPTKTQVLNLYRGGIDARYWNFSFAKRPEEEMYDMRNDMDCINNLAMSPDYQGVKEELKEILFGRLKEMKDPRVVSDNPNVFDHYKFNESKNENFYERIKSGELTEPWNQTHWVNPTDYSGYQRNAN
ncbi:MAG: sulfatase [Massilibacteroides sp.]|nr:sulfatase [Massilibacteroides sp.]